MEVLVLKTGVHQKLQRKVECRMERIWDYRLLGLTLKWLVCTSAFGLDVSQFHTYKNCFLSIDICLFCCIGLDVENDRILEIACIMTNGSLSKSIEVFKFLIWQSDTLDSSVAVFSFFHLWWLSFQLSKNSLFTILPYKQKFVFNWNFRTYQ